MTTTVELSEETLSFLFAILGSDTWMEAGMIWGSNPERRKAAHSALSLPQRRDSSASVDAEALDLANRIEQELLYDRSGVQTRARIQCILAEALTSARITPVQSDKTFDIAIRETAKALRLGLDNTKMREALEAIADGEGDADAIARQTLDALL